LASDVGANTEPPTASSHKQARVDIVPAISSFWAAELAYVGEIAATVKDARNLAMRGEDEAAKQAYVAALRLDPTCFDALNDLGALTYASGHRSAARTAYRQAVRHHPANPIARVNLANLLAEDGDHAGAQAQYEQALEIDPDFPEAHRGLARIFSEPGDERAELHRQKGFLGHAIDQKRCRGAGPGAPILLLASVHHGNTPTKQWIDERLFAVTVVYVEFWDAGRPLPPHELIVNVIGDADLCDEALRRAEALIAQSAAPVVNPPARVRATGRANNARRLAALPGVVAPKIATLTRADVLAADGFDFPLLLRAPGFHTGQHFLYVEDRQDLAKSVEALPGDALIAIQYLDARGPDGMARKYRVMCIDGKLFPLHLAISAGWMVHYFTAAMATQAAYREEERRFLEDMPGALGERAMAALAALFGEIGLDYVGADFALAPDGSLLLFEANATMVVIPPPADPMWDYRRAATANVLEAAKRMASSRAGIGAADRSA